MPFNITQNDCGRAPLGLRSSLIVAGIVLLLSLAAGIQAPTAGAQGNSSSGLDQYLEQNPSAGGNGGGGGGSNGSGGGGGGGSSSSGGSGGGSSGSGGSGGGSGGSGGSDENSGIQDDVNDSNSGDARKKAKQKREREQKSAAAGDVAGNSSGGSSGGSGGSSGGSNALASQPLPKANVANDGGVSPILWIVLALALVPVGWLTVTRLRRRRGDASTT